MGSPGDWVNWGLDALPLVTGRGPAPDHGRRVVSVAHYLMERGSPVKACDCAEASCSNA